MEIRNIAEQYPELYNPAPGVVEEVNIPAFNYLNVQGVGAFDSGSFLAACEEVQTAAQVLRNLWQEDIGFDVALMPIEVLVIDEDFWRVLGVQPGGLRTERVYEVLEGEGLGSVRFDPLQHGKCLQLRGSKSDSWKLTAELEEQKLRPWGPQSFIILDDEDIIFRQPFMRLG